MIKSLTMSLALAPLVGMAATPDASFYKHAGEGGIAEVGLGNLAQQKASSADVKSFASMMVSDHTAANDKLKALAATKDVSLPTSPSMGQMATKAKLEVLTGDTFDKSYISAMVKDHQATIALFKKEAATGQDADAKAFAAATLPTLKTHLTKIKAIASASGVTS